MSLAALESDRVVDVGAATARVEEAAERTGAELGAGVRVPRVEVEEVGDAGELDGVENVGPHLRQLVLEPHDLAAPVEVLGRLGDGLEDAGLEVGRALVLLALAV